MSDIHLIEAIFSTTFFNFQAGPHENIISPHFWIFWALAIPFTLVSMGLLGAYRWIGGIQDKKSEARLEMMTTELTKFKFAGR